MAVGATIDINPINADISVAQTSIAPPLCGTKQTNDWSSSGDCQMSRAGIAANVNLRALDEFVESF